MSQTTSGLTTHGAALATGRAGDRDRHTARWVGWLRIGSLIVLLACTLLFARLLPTERLLQALSTWIEGAGLWGPVAFAMIYVIATVLLLPGAVLTLAAGAIFGLVWGMVAVSAGSTLGAAAAFLIARYVARDAVARRLHRFPRFAAVDRAVGEGGWKIVMLLRLSPAVPFNLQNYLYGLTAIRFWPCVLASWAAMLPGTFLYVYLGYAGRAGIAAAAGANGGRSLGQWVMLVIGLLATIVVTVYVTRLARRAIRQQAETGPSLDVAEPPPSANQPARPPRVATALLLAALAGAAVVLTACAYLNPQRVTSLFGPPAVVMAESYESRPEGPAFDHSTFDSLLRKHVHASGGVDYAALKQDARSLRGYMTALAEAPFDAMDRDEKLALLINAYNAFTLQLIVEHLDQGIASIRDIPDAKRWNDKRWSIGGRTFSLNQIEHEQIRPNFREPRIHFALVCAAVGCPPLRTEAYEADRLDEQLAEQAQRVHADGSRWFQHDGETNVMRLTPLYNWYAGDFEQVAGSVLDYAARYSDRLRRALEQGRRPRIEWLDYDWSLNSRENLP